MSISVETVKQLRELSGAGVMECKAALEKCQGDMKKAHEDLKAKGFAKAAKKAERVTSQGIVACYVHNGSKLGAMVEVACETDFVARTDQFQKLAHDLAMQVAAAAPTYVSEADIPADLPEDKKVDPVVACLMKQPFIKDPAMTMEDVVKQTIGSLGENIRVRRFVRFDLGN